MSVGQRQELWWRSRPATSTSSHANRPFLNQSVRKPLLAVHVISSVAWIGVELALIALGLTGMLSDDPDRVRAVYIAMGVLGWAFLPTVSVVALLSGVVLGLGTKWGLFRTGWVFAKLLITVPMTFMGIVFLNDRLQDAANEALSGNVSRWSDLGPERFPISYVPWFGLTLLVLATLLSVYKPRRVGPLGRQSGVE